MFKLSFSVVVKSVKVAKDENSNNYADFLFTGGSMSIVVTDEQLKALMPLEGQEISATFQMEPIQIIRFNRPTVVLDFTKLISIDKKG